MHNGAALARGRRAFKFKEKIPKLLKDKLLEQNEKDAFNEQNNWKQWSVIIKKIKSKGGEYPGFWLKHRKLILNIS